MNMFAPLKGTEATSGERLRVLILSLSFWVVGCTGASDLFASDKIRNEVQEAQSANGLTVILKEEHKNKIAAIHLRVNVGSATEGEFAGSGIAHLIEHMLFKGTKTRGPGEMQREIESQGGSINAFTSLDDTSFELNCPSEHFEQALSLLADALMNSTFDEAQLALEKEVILSEMRLNEDNPQRYLAMKFWEKAYTVHPYKYPVIGRRELFRNITQKECLAFYKENYIPQNMVLSVVGDVQKEEALEKIALYFKNLIPAPRAPRALPEEPRQVIPRTYEEGREISLAYITMGFHSVMLNDNDLFPLDVLAVVLGQGERSRLDVSLRKKRNLVYSIESWNYTPRYPGLFIISCSAEYKYKEAIIEAIFEELERIKRYGITKKELNSAKERVLSDYLFSRQTPAAEARDFASGQMLTGAWDFSSKYVDGIKRVRAEDVRIAASKYLEPSSLTSCILHPKLSSLEGARQRCASEIGVKDIERITLPNGVRVLLREDRTNPIVTFRACFKGGVRFETLENNGLSNLTAQVLIKGTKSFTPTEIAELLDSMGVRLNAISGNNTFGFQLEMQSKDIRKVVALTCALISNPTFPKEEIALERALSLSAIKARDDDIFGSSLLALKQRLFSTHPYRFDSLGTEEALNNLRREDLLEFYSRIAFPEDIVISIFGDFSSEDIKREVLAQTSLLKLKRRGMSEPIIEAQDRPSKQEFIKIPKEKEQALIMLGFLGTTIENKDRYALEIIAALLSEGGGRLYERLREKSGLAYTTGAYSVPGIEPGYIVVYAAVSPSQSEKARNELISVMEDLKKEPIDAEELQRAKRYLKGMQTIELQTNSNLAERTALDELYGLGYDNYKRYNSEIDLITPADLSATVARYLNLANSIVVVTEPKASATNR